MHSQKFIQMKKWCLTFAIAVFLLFFVSGIQAQTTQTKLNQVELYRQLTGTWKYDYNTDTILFWEIKSFGGGFEVRVRAELKDRTIFYEAKSFIGYDNKNDRLIESQVKSNSPNIFLYIVWFTSSNRFIEILLENISSPEKSTEKWAFELKSPDLIETNYMKSDKIIAVSIWNRLKE